MTVWIAVECPDCHSTDIIKHGKSSENKQRFLCQNPECLRLELKNTVRMDGELTKEIFPKASTRLVRERYKELREST